MLLIVVLKSQTIDDAVIKTDTNAAAWTTGKIQTPWVNDANAGQVMQVKLNDV